MSKFKKIRPDFQKCVEKVLINNYVNRVNIMKLRTVVQLTKNSLTSQIIVQTI